MKCLDVMSAVRVCGASMGAVLFAGLVAGCADAPPASDPEAVAEYNRTNDPLEPWNRGVYDVNMALDKAVLAPAATRYRDNVPESVRDGVRNFMYNLSSPMIFANDLLQCEPTLASDTFYRFLFNSVVGLGGLNDVAGEYIPRHENDVGKTLGVWGVDEGPYLVLPVLGPSNPRDAFGIAVQYYADPFDRYAENMGYWYVPFIHGAIEGLSRRTDNLDTLDEIERTSIDPYSTLRSLYRQYRQSLIDGKPVKDKPRPGISGGFPDTVELTQETN